MARPAAAQPASSAVHAVRSEGPLGELLAGLVGAMSDEDVRTALEYCRDWNTNARHCHAAHALLGALLRAHAPEKLLRVQGEVVQTCSLPIFWPRL